MLSSRTYNQTPDSLAHQWQIVKKDKWLLSVLTWLPILLMVSLWWVFSSSIARDIPIGVVDLDHSQVSRQMVQHYDATSSLSVSAHYTDTHQAKLALQSDDIYAYVVIPKDTSKLAYLAQPPQVTAFFNSQYILVGRLVNSALLQAQGTFNAKLDAGKILAKGNATPTQALGKAVPIRSQITPLFNSNTSYSQFLISAVVPAIWQIAIVVSTVMIIAAQLRTQTLSSWLGNTPVSRLVRTLAPYSVIFALHGLALLYWLFVGIGWAFNGSFLLVIICQLLMILACMIMGSLFFFLTMDATRAMSFAGAYTAPSFAFMGITFPVTDMSPLAQAWRSLLPVSHYIEGQVYQASYGANVWQTLTTQLPMLGFIFPALLVMLLVKKRLAKEVIA